MDLGNPADHGFDPARLLEERAALDLDAAARRGRQSAHDGDGGGDHQGAGAGNHQKHQGLVDRFEPSRAG